MIVSIRDRIFDVAEEPKDFWGWVAEGRYDNQWKRIDEYLRPEHTFLDLGAWIGSHSLYASRVAKRVLAIEPDPIARAILTRNTKGTDIEIFDCAITGHKGIVKLGSGFLGASTTRVNPIAGGGIGPWEEGQSFDTWSTTLRRFVEKLEVQNPLFIKMDVEGSEEDILEDISFFEEHRPIVYLESHPWWWKDEKATRMRINEIAKLCPVIK